jgi:hypothetical protein
VRIGRVTKPGNGAGVGLDIQAPMRVFKAWGSHPWDSFHSVQNILISKSLSFQTMAGGTPPAILVT